MLKRTALLSAVRIRISQIGTGLQNSSRELDSAIHHRTEHAMIILDRLRERLRAINPSAVLDRGYALVLSPEGKIITRKAQVNGIPKMKVRFADGEIEVEHHG
jgi:exodeoxyribonuclease VII large subunit